MDALAAFLIFVILLLAEFYAANAWFAPFYRFGIPIFAVKAKRAPAADLAAAAARLSQVFKSTPRHPSILFKPIDAEHIALHENLFEHRAGIRYLPVMHTVIRYNRAANTVSLNGYLNWSILAALAFLIYRVSVDPSFIPVAILLVVVFLVSYISQAALLQQIAKYLAGQDAP